MEQARRRGRPRGFEDATVVAAAQALFWARGFDAVTLDDVTAATGVHKPSLYAAFGTKLGLYLATIDAYRAAAEARRGEALAAATLAEAVRGWLAAEIAVFTPQARGCYLFSVAAAATRHRGVGLRLRREIKAIDLALHERIARARGEGQASQTDAGTVIDLAMATHIALAARARAGELAPVLEERISRIVGSLAL